MILGCNPGSGHPAPLPTEPPVTRVKIKDALYITDTQIWGSKETGERRMTILNMAGAPELIFRPLRFCSVLSLKVTVVFLWLFVHLFEVFCLLGH